MKGNNCPYYNIFHGIVYCATCGKSMQVRYEKAGRSDKDRRTGREREPIDKAYYICQTYNRLGKNACTSHKIEARDLYSLVLYDIQEIASLISNGEQSDGDIRMFMDEIKRYATVMELDETVLNRLVNRIIIGNPEKIDGVRTQEVRIIYNFVGEFK